MAHVQISSKKGGGYTLLVDGHDLSNHVIADGFRVNLHDSMGPASVTMTIAADMLDVDLPEAVVYALAAGGAA